MASEELQLAGQIDLLHVTAYGGIITELKTGNAKAEDGALLSRYLDQLHYYLMLARACGYGPDLQLRILASDGSFSVDIDRVRTASLEMRLQAAVIAAPLGVERSASSLAKLSAFCCSCSHRPWCGPYLTGVPALWQTPAPAFVPPSDIWGTVTRVTPTSDSSDFSTVYLRDAADRLACVTGVPRRLSESLAQVGRRVGFFGVLGKSNGPGHPQNFVLGVPGNLRRGSHIALVVGL